jgi:hypothetical protein
MVTLRASGPLVWPNSAWCHYEVITAHKKSVKLDFSKEKLAIGLSHLVGVKDSTSRAEIN